MPDPTPHAGSETVPFWIFRPEPIHRHHRETGMQTPNLLIRGGQVLDAASGKTTRQDIRIRNGVIAELGSLTPDGDEPVFDATGKTVSIGWMDMHVHLREPGQEYKETIETGCRAAAFGGFTAVACMPNTTPPIATRDVVEFIVERSRRLPVDVYPIACVSKRREGKELAEMADMMAGGAVAFSDDGSPVQDGGGSCDMPSNTRPCWTGPSSTTWRT
jgi:dihydroorotase